MPLRDHKKTPYSYPKNLQAIHGMWPAMIVMSLNKQLPPNYQIKPTVHLGSNFELDIAAYEQHDFDEGVESDFGSNLAVVSLPKPTMVVKTAEPDYSEYEVSIYDENETLVAVIELVSASNKDRPDSRAAFASKCAALWNNKICVSIIDLIPAKFNLYTETLENLGHKDKSFSPKPPSQYAMTMRARNGLPNRGWQLESWAYELKAGESLPPLPIWLNEKTALLLDLDATYEQVLKELRLK